MSWRRVHDLKLLPLLQKEKYFIVSSIMLINITNASYLNGWTVLFLSYIMKIWE